jgi:hypothetical protein
VPGKVHRFVVMLFDQWEKGLLRPSGKSKFAKAIRYALSRRTASTLMEIDSNIVERATRPQKIMRKMRFLARRMALYARLAWPRRCMRSQSPIIAPS